MKIGNVYLEKLPNHCMEFIQLICDAEMPNKDAKNVIIEKYGFTKKEFYRDLAEISNFLKENMSSAI